MQYRTLSNYTNGEFLGPRIGDKFIFSLLVRPFEVTARDTHDMLLRMITSLLSPMYAIYRGLLVYVLHETSMFVAVDHVYLLVGGQEFLGRKSHQPGGRAVHVRTKPCTRASEISV